jgi:hypothetical protein
MPEVEHGQVFKNQKEEPVKLHAKVDSEIPVDLTWTWSHTEAEAEWERTDSLKWSDGPLFFTLDPLPWARVDKPDGKYLLTLTAKDLAGNDANPAKWELEVAVEGPVLKLHAPTKGQIWKPKKGVWELRVDARDPNGIEDLRYTIERKVWADKLPPLPETYLELEWDENEYVGSLEVPYTWSESEVDIHLLARDKHGNETEEQYGPFTLPSIDPSTPPRIQPKQGSAMCLVKGISRSSTYIFGGRGDATENDDFRKAGLTYKFNSLGGRSRSWRISCVLDDIPDFYLDEHEVTCEDFLRFVNSDDWSSGEDRQSRLRASLAAVPSKGLPVTSVTWAEANAYATWIGKRLPTWFEFEYAVRGGVKYRPFASYDRGGQANPSASSAGKMQPVKTGKDQTPDTKIHDLAGNVSEWTATPSIWDEPQGEYRKPDPKQTTSEAKNYWTAGASYARRDRDFSIADSRRSSFQGQKLGFRCALTLEKYLDDPSIYQAR